MEDVMKKIIMTISMIILLVSLSGCSKENQNQTEATATPVPTATPTVTIPAEDTAEDTTADELSVKDYFPLLSDIEYIYEGQGNEFAAYNQVTDFIDMQNNRIQTRTNNGGTETVRVIEIKDGKVTVMKAINECYYRENLMADAVTGDDAEVLLMEPLVPGTVWSLPDGRKRTISAVNVAIDTSSGSYQAIEVTTEGTDSITKDYYAPQVGLVKSVFGSGDMEVTSSLKEIKTDTPFTQTISIFYPDADEKIYVEQMPLEFRTNDDTKQILQAAISKEASKDSYLPLASINTKINSLYLGEDNIVHIDFSKELVSDMNAGAGYESLILQSITDTLGNYYGVQEVLVTMEGKPYESGHILMKEGETFKVNFDNVVY
jgi:hypothetical protein